MKSGFLDKLIDRLDRLDSKSLQPHFLRLAREKGLLETIFQSIQEGVVVIDHLGAISYANKAAEQLIGFSIETARGRPVARYLKEIDWERILRLDAGEWSRLVTREMEITYPERRFISFYVVPLLPSDESERGAVIILRDITNDREQEATVLESERINAIKLLAAGVAHEIGNPLNALNIHLQLLDREIHALADDRQLKEGGSLDAGRALELAQNLSELLGVARNEVSRLDLIITQFLRAIRPSTPNLAPCRIENLMEETLLLLEQEIQNRKIAVEIERADPLPSIEADRDQIKQAFFNVIKNAFQAMPDGGALSIRLSSSDQFLSVSFLDTGEGIKPENLGRLFEPYQTTKAAGSGLGLMIVQRIIQEHGGQIEVVSKPGVGTGVTILLPLTERRIRLLTRGGESGESSRKSRSRKPGR